MIKFQHPEAFLLLLIPLLSAVYFLIKKRKQHTPVQLPLSPPSELTHHTRTTKRIFQLLFVTTLLTFVLIITIIARPYQTRKWIEKWTEGIDIMLVLDVSESMDATDFRPNRIRVAKQVLNDFIEKRSSDRIGLVTFGGEAVTKAPLTRDYDFLLSQLANVQLRELKQGTAIGMAIANAVGRLRRSTAKSRVIILLTDGDSNVGSINPVTASHLAKEERIKIYAIGIGKKSRVEVPIFAYDRHGRKTHLLTKVPSYLNPELLNYMAKLTNGKAYMATDGNSLERVLKEIDQLEKSRTKVLGREEKEEKFTLLAIVATCLLGGIYLLQETRFRRIRLAS